MTRGYPQPSQALEVAEAQRDGVDVTSRFWADLVADETYEVDGVKMARPSRWPGSGP